MTGHAGQVRAVVTGAGSPEIKWLLNPPTTSRRGGGTVHPAIPDLRRTYGSVYARFTLGSTPVLRSGFVRFASGLVGIRTGLVPDFRIRTGFRTQKVE